MNLVKKQKGDTIVEVLIAIAIVVAVLAGAYISSSQSTDTTIRSRERDEAVKIAQTQIELLRSAVGFFPNVSAEPKPFCMYLDSSAPDNQIKIAKFTELPSNDIPEDPESTNPSVYPAECQIDSNNNPYNSASRGAKYLVSVKSRPEGPGDANLYRATVRWEQIGGGWGQVNFRYRVYP